MPGGGLDVPQICRISGTNTVLLGGGVDRDKDQVSLDNGLVHVGGEEEVAPATFLDNLVQTRFVYWEIVGVPSRNSSWVHVDNGDLNVGVFLGSSQFQPFQIVRGQILTSAITAQVGPLLKLISFPKTRMPEEISPLQLDHKFYSPDVSSTNTANLFDLQMLSTRSNTTKRSAQPLLAGSNGARPLGDILRGFQVSKNVVHEGQISIMGSSLVTFDGASVDYREGALTKKAKARGTRGTRKGYRNW